MYITIELQTNNGQTANIVTSHQTLEEAESKFHLILSSAAVSEIPVHAAAILDDHGLILANGSYEHGGE